MKARHGGRPGAPRGFSPTARTDPFEMLAAEHALLRRQLARALEAARGGPDRETEEDPLAALEAALRVHQDREENALYPICERMFGGKEGVAAVLREGHEALLSQVAELVRDPGRGSVQRVARVKALSRLAEDHFAQEERVLFPMTAALLSGTENAALARRLRAAPAT